MLVARYFFWVGSVLVATLLLANWYFTGAPSTPAQQVSAETPVQQTIRIQSERKLPDKVVIDTTVPTIIPPSPPVAVAAAAPPPVAAAPPTAMVEARAEMKPAAPKRQARVHRRSPRPAPRMWAYGNSPYGNSPYGNSVSPRWSWSWNW